MFAESVYKRARKCVYFEQQLADVFVLQADLSHRCHDCCSRLIQFKGTSRSPPSKVWLWETNGEAWVRIRKRERENKQTHLETLTSGYLIYRIIIIIIVVTVDRTTERERESVEICNANAASCYYYYCCCRFDVFLFVVVVVVIFAILCDWAWAAVALCVCVYVLLVAELVSNIKWFGVRLCCARSSTSSSPLSLSLFLVQTRTSFRALLLLLFCVVFFVVSLCVCFFLSFLAHQQQQNNCVPMCVFQLNFNTGKMHKNNSEQIVIKL